MPLGAFRLNSLGMFSAPAGRTALTITTVGNAQVSTAQSKFGGASLLLDGAGDYLYADNSAGTLSFGTSQDFTFEAWCRFANTNTYFTILSGPGQTSSFIVQRGNDNILRVGRTNTAWDAASTSNATAANTFQHIAVSRSSGTLRIFVNGTSVHSSANTQAYPCAYNLGVGGDTTYGSESNGYMDEVRVSNIARYTANFTPSTTAFTNDANTVFLMHANGTNASTTFTDDIGTNFIPRTPRTITVGGNAQVSTAQSKFGGASALFDGTSDYLSVPGFSDLAFGTGNFTLEAWVRQSARSDAMTIFDTRNSGNTSGGFVLYMRADNVMELYWNSAYTSSANPLPTVNTWYHVAVSRSGTALKVFVDGTAVISVTDSQNHSAAGPFIIGQDFQLTGTPGNSWNGYIDEVRFSNTARYTTTFTPSAAAFTNDRDTLLLLHCNGTNASTTFTDDNGVRSPKGISAVGNAQVSTAQSKFGGASALFDGTGDRLDITSSSDLAFGTGAFTIEFWVRFTSRTGNQVFIDFRDSNNSSSANILFGSDGGSIYLYVNGAYVIGRSGTQFAADNTWYHVAVSRSGTSTKAFVDGTQVLSTYTDSTSYIGTAPDIGEINSSFGLTGFGVKGYLDEFRISNSARYTANFTPSASAFTNDVNTLLLIHANGTNASTTFTDDNA
jgi:hypothetical protein